MSIPRSQRTGRVATGRVATTPAQRESMARLIEQLRELDGVTWTVDGLVITITGYVADDIRVLTDAAGEQWVGGFHLSRVPK